MWLTKILTFFGVLLLFDFLFQKIYGALSNKRFLTFMLMFVGSSFAVFLFLITAYPCFVFISLQTPFAMLVPVLVIIVINCIGYRKLKAKYTKPYAVAYGKCIRSLLGLATLVGVAAFFYFLELQKTIVPSTLVLKLLVGITIFFLLVYTFLLYSEFSLRTMLASRIGTQPLASLLVLQRENGSFVLEKKDISKDILWLLDFRIFQVLNKKTILEMKSGESEIFQFTDAALKICGELEQRTFTKEQPKDAV